MIQNLTRTRPTAHALVLALTALPFALSAACDDAAPPDSGKAEVEEQGSQDAELAPPLADGEERLGEGVSSLADIEVGGSRLAFHRIEVPESGDRTLVLMEEQRAGGVSLGLEPALAGASMLDIFLAVTGPELEIPEELLGYEDNHLGPRGWFADKALRGEYPIPRASCVDSTFQDELEDWQPLLGEGEVIENDLEEWFLNASPDGAMWYGPHVPNLGITCPACTSIWYDYLRFNDEWAVENVDGHKQQATICNIGTRPQICNTAPDPDQCIPHLGPELKAEYRTRYDAHHEFYWSKDLAATDEGTRWRFYWLGSPTVSNWDWKWEIDHAVDADLFDIGYISAHRGW